MNKDQVEGRLDEAKGKIKSVAGKAVGNERLRAEGQADQLSGKAQKNYGDGKEKLKDVAERAIDKL
ncbi:CsbD family protein [Xenophilus arseniciresistens]|uniref:CsbD family protein n=1 Tax=Xenophilus arseniciresistens TaxID=1283306 RepID=A0AAE3N634_9BURK|nr:CsbD family protein [Xenophilus arseniciresistens]MDA7415568.1 CsbD family protein [Xenophilus arseniciresistens]